MKRIKNVLKNMIFVKDEGDIENSITNQLNFDLQQKAIRNKIYINDDNTRKYEIYISDGSSIGFMESDFTDENVIHDKLYIVKDKLPLTKYDDINGFGSFFSAAVDASIKKTGRYQLSIYFVYFSKWFILDKNRYRTLLANEDDTLHITVTKNSQGKLKYEIKKSDIEGTIYDYDDESEINMYDIMWSLLPVF